MIKILLIEDEIPARKKLKRFIQELDTTTEILGEIDTVQNAIQFLKNNQVDLIFSDIELLDGNAFEIYQQVEISCPIIFTTAYDKFWLEAFESNGIAYLLKPFSKERFKKSWDKFLLFQQPAAEEKNWIKSVSKFIEQNIAEKLYKKRFTIHTSQGFYFLTIEEILFFKADEGVLFAYDKKSQKHMLSESTLKEIVEQLDPSVFFRINRSELINKLYVEKIEHYTKNSLAIKLKGFEQLLKTSQSSTADFRRWIEK